MPIETDQYSSRVFLFRTSLTTFLPITNATKAVATAIKILTMLLFLDGPPMLENLLLGILKIIQPVNIQNSSQKINWDSGPDSGSNALDIGFEID